MSDLVGFLTYDPAIGLESISQEFLHDFELLSKKIYLQYRLKITFDDYMSKALEHVCKSLAHYDPTRSISTFIYSILWQCAYDSEKSMRRESFESSEDVLLSHQDDVPYTSSISVDLDISFRRGLHAVAERFFRQGIYVNQERVYLDFISSTNTPLVNAILWEYVIPDSDTKIPDGTLFSVLEKISVTLGLDMELVMALYSVLGNDLFFMLDSLKGRRLNVSKTFSLS